MENERASGHVPSIPASAAPVVAAITVVGRSEEAMMPLRICPCVSPRIEKIRDGFGRSASKLEPNNTMCLRLSTNFDLRDVTVELKWSKVWHRQCSSSAC
jgi:hypothetical protein